MSVQLSECAAEQVKTQLQSRGKGLGLRLGVKKSGCSGFAYVIDFADSINDGDSVFEEHGVKVVVDSEALSFLDGTRVDYRRDGINAAFSFENPNVKDSCGCGESFTV